MKPNNLPSLLIFLSTIGCASYPEGLRATPQGDGPTVLIDWDAEPLPELPFPNDLATRVDENSPTGRRLNFSTESITQYESETRAKLNELSGFGIYSFITVAFDDKLDLDNIATRHRDDPKLGNEQFSDDAFFLINVDPDSPDYLKPVELEVGQNRLPVDVPNTNRFFPNDSRFESPTVVFDTVDEDVNGNGILDWGEDTDNDGILDIPNIYPLDGDPRDDLLTFYERNTNTLIVRPLVPLREETTYAMVMTERLIGEDGNPVRSPWEYVNHLQQTEALEPLESALPSLGLTTDDVAYAWTFSTGRVTGDLVDIRRGLYGEGPFAVLESAFPAGVIDAKVMHDVEDQDPHLLETYRVANLLSLAGEIDGDGASIIINSYEQYSEFLVGGSFNSPNFLADRDDDGRDESDEWFQLNPVDGSYSAESNNITFSCITPTPTPDNQPPHDVVLYSHGYGSSRGESLSFGWGFTQLGYAFCFMDSPGHGLELDGSLQETIEPIADAMGLMSFLNHLLDARHRDLNNDGSLDSGGDQWSADVFHTRDMVRQDVVDKIQFVRTLKQCGSGNMTMSDGTTSKTCDWNQDGVADLGGSDAEFFMLGGSLGGINVGVAAAVMPEVEAFAPVVGGAGLIDMALRTEIGGAVEAMHGRLMSPLFLGYPDEDGNGLQIVQMVNSERRMKEVPIWHLDNIPANGKIVVENLGNNTAVEGWIPEDGRFRVGIEADALDPTEKRQAAGIPEAGPEEGMVYSVPDNEGLGDQLVIKVYDENDQLLQEITTWETEVTHEGVTMAAGSPLVAASYGTGRIRGSSNMRRIASVFGAALEAGDPAAYSSHYMLDPFEELGGKPTNILLMPTAGDTIVPVSAGIAQARIAGFIPQGVIDERYGMTVDQWLVDRGVIQGLADHGGHTDINGDPCLFDADDFDSGMDGKGAPSDAPLRLTVQTSRGQSGLRIPYISTTGSHGFRVPELDKAFDQNSFAINQIAHYFYTRGQQISDDYCLADFSCEWYPDIGQYDGD